MGQLRDERGEWGNKGKKPGRGISGGTSLAIAVTTQVSGAIAKLDRAGANIGKVDLLEEKFYR